MSASTMHRHMKAFARRLLYILMKSFFRGGWLWVYSRRAGAWAVRELGSLSLCVVCVYLGIMSTLWLPPTLLLLVGGSVTPGHITWLMAIPITIVVCDRRAYGRWRSSHRAPLGVRMLRALSDGVTWWRWWKSLRR
jgi:hypothetical protein